MPIRLFILALTTLLSACAVGPNATPREIALDVPTTLETSFRFTDSSTKTDGFSPFVLKPAGPEIVKTWLQQSLSEQLRGKSVRLETFSVGVMRQPRLSMSSHPPALSLMDDALAGNVYFVTIEGKVEEFPFYVHVNDRGNSLIQDLLLRGLLNQARRHLEQGAKRAASLSPNPSIERASPGKPGDAAHVER